MVSGGRVWFAKLCRTRRKCAARSASPVVVSVTTTRFGSESNSPVAFAAMMRYRDPQWGAAPVRQSLARCVDHLCQWLIVILQGGLRRHPDNPIELSESQACFGFARVADMKVADLRALLAQHAEEPATADEAARPVTAPG